MTTTETVPAHLRPAAVRDRSRVEQLLAANHLPLEGVSDALSSFIVAEAGEEIVGVAGLEVCCDNALLRSVAVRVVSDAESRGIHALYLLTTTADRYFPGFGFRAVTREDVPADVRATAEFQGACPASATVMMRPSGMTKTAPNG